MNKTSEESRRCDPSASDAPSQMPYDVYGPPPVFHRGAGASGSSALLRTLIPLAFGLVLGFVIGFLVRGTMEPTGQRETVTVGGAETAPCEEDASYGGC